jgi:hypothetical protein
VCEGLSYFPVQGVALLRDPLALVCSEEWQRGQAHQAGGQEMATQGRRHWVTFGDERGLKTGAPQMQHTERWVAL